MKNTALLIDIVQYIYQLPDNHTISPSNGTSCDPDDEACIVTNAMHAGVVPRDIAESIQYQVGFSEHFDISRSNASEFLWGEANGIISVKEYSVKLHSLMQMLGLEPAAPKVETYNPFLRRPKIDDWIMITDDTYCHCAEIGEMRQITQVDSSTIRFQNLPDDHHWSTSSEENIDWRFATQEEITQWTLEHKDEIVQELTEEIEVLKEYQRRAGVPPDEHPDTYIPRKGDILTITSSHCAHRFHKGSLVRVIKDARWVSCSNRGKRVSVEAKLLASEHHTHHHLDPHVEASRYVTRDWELFCKKESHAIDATTIAEGTITAPSPFIPNIIRSQPEHHIMVKIEKRTYLGTTNGAEISDDSIFGFIKENEEEIRSLEKIETQSSTVEKRIAALELNAAQLASYLDARSK